MRIAKTTEVFKWEVASLTYDEYSVLGEYQRALLPILMRHNTCGHEWMVNPNNFIKGSRCPACYKKKRTHDEFKAIVAEVGKGEYEVLGTYRGSTLPIEFKHLLCGHQWSKRPNVFLKTPKCPKCAMHGQRNHHAFAEEIQQLTQNEYKLIGTFRTVQHLVKVKHVTCGYEWEVRPNNFLNGSRCPQCHSQRKRTTEDFKAYVKEETGEEYQVLEAYQTGKTPIKMKHVLCGYEWMIRPANFQQGTRCPNCSRRKTRKTPDEFEKEVYQLTQGEYSVLEPYELMMEPVRMRHERCGYEWCVIPGNFLSGTRCPRCQKQKASNKKRMSQQEFISRIQAEVGSQFLPASTYDGFYRPVKIQHTECQQIWETTPQKIFLSRRCPFCQPHHIRTEAQFDFQLSQMKTQDFVRLSTYNGQQHPLCLQHLSCGYEWNATPSQFLKHPQCPHCQSASSKSHITNHPSS